MKHSHSSAKAARRKTTAGEKITKPQFIGCACHDFLRRWLAGRKDLSDDDFAVAMLIHLLWSSRDMAGEKDAWALTFQPGILDILGVKFPSGGLDALRRLENAGIVKMPCPTAKTFVMVELPWLSSEESD